MCADPRHDCDLCAHSAAIWETARTADRPPWTAADDAMTDNTDDPHALVSEDAERWAAEKYDNYLCREAP